MMKIKDDFIELINIFSEIEEFDMWVPEEHSSLAYVIEKLSATNEYEKTIKQWKMLAKDAKYNDLSRSIAEKEAQFIKNDDKATEKEKKHVYDRVLVARENYEVKRLCRYGFIPDRLVPDWFWELYGAYMPIEVLKRENTIVKCCMEQESMSYEEAYAFYLSLKKYYALICDFYFYAKTGRLRKWDPASVKRITAKDIIERTGLSPIGAYRYMLYLRENPEKALAKLEAGLTLKSSYEWE